LPLARPRDWRQAPAAADDLFFFFMMGEESQSNRDLVLEFNFGRALLL